MDLTTRLAASLTHRLRKLRGTQESFTVELGGVFYQAASYEGDAVLIEITGDEFLPEQRRLTGAQHEQLLQLGFTRPDDAMPNWWIGIEDGRDRDLFTAARAVISALIDVHGVSTDELIAGLPICRYSRYPSQTLHARPAPTRPEGDPLGVQAIYGDVLLYPNGYATLNGEPWAEQPVTQWQRLDDGRLAITMAIPADEYFPNIGFVADTEANAAALRGFLPSREHAINLAHRLAVAEQYALTCIATGTLRHERLFRAPHWSSNKPRTRSRRPRSSGGTRRRAWPPLTTSSRPSTSPSRPIPTGSSTATKSACGKPSRPGCDSRRGRTTSNSPSSPAPRTSRPSAGPTSKSNASTEGER